MKFQIEAAKRLSKTNEMTAANSTWWESMDEDSQKEYLKKHPNSEYAPGNNKEPVTKSKDGFLKNVFQKGKDKVGDLLEKGKHGLLDRLKDPLSITKEKQPTKKKVTPKVQTKPKDNANRGGDAGPTKKKNGVNHLVSPAYKQSGEKGISPFGYWKDKNTWVSETEEEWEKSLTPKERKHFGR